MCRRIIFFVALGLLSAGINKLSFAMMCAEHGAGGQSVQAYSEHEHGVIETEKTAVAQEAVNAGNKICPVSGEKVGQSGMAPATYEYKGKIYNFCCSECIEEFKNDPEKYIKKVEEELSVEALPAEMNRNHHHEMTQTADSELSGRVENGIRVVEVKAIRYKFEPDPIVVKLGEKVRLAVTAVDVEHGIAIADFNVDLQVPEGKTETVEFVADKKGSFHAHCSVYCGPGHGQMHGALIVK